MNNNGFGWGRDDASHDSDLAYQFTISSGAVTGEEVVFGNGHTHTVLIGSNDSFTVGTGTVTETIAGQSATETVTFGLETGSATLYQVTGTSVTFTDPTGAQPFGGTLTYGFTLTNGAVTGESETLTFGHWSHSFTLSTPDDAVFTLGTGTITESWVSGDHVKSVTYTELTGTSNYAMSEISSTLIAPGSAATLLDVKPDRQAMFTTGSSGSITAAEFVNPDGHTVSVSANDHIAFTSLGTGYVEETVTWGSHSRYVVYYDASGSGTYTDVAHGSGTTVDLVGLKAQIAELPAALAATV